MTQPPSTTEVDRLRELLTQAVRYGDKAQQKKITRELLLAFDLEHETELTHCYIENGWLEDDDHSI